MLTVKTFITQQKYFASAFLYSCFSLIFSTWITYIPYIADKIGITEGKIGGAIFFMALGSFLMIPFANRLVDCIGVGRSTYMALVVYSMTLFVPFLSYNYVTLCICLFIFGMASSWYGISLNSLTAIIEKQDNVYIMTGSHGFWSIGGMIGASTGSFIAALLHNPFIHVALLISIILGVQTYLRSHYYFRKGEHRPREKRPHIRHILPLVIISIIGLLCMIVEGAIADWGALYLKKIIHVSVQYIGMGYGAFSFAMMIGRFAGDSLSKRNGSWQLITYATLTSIAGFILVLMLNPLVSIAGFFIVGLGFSVIIPEVFRLASNVKEIKTSEGVSFIAATSNIGFLVGPVLLGFLAELRSLHLSFMALATIVTLACLISFWKNRLEKTKNKNTS